jgi:hypothetical protein
MGFALYVDEHVRSTVVVHLDVRFCNVDINVTGTFLPFIQVLRDL